MIATFTYEVTMITPGLRQMCRQLVSKGGRGVSWLVGAAGGDRARFVGENDGLDAVAQAQLRQ
jgi:hypothetical protein